MFLQLVAGFTHCLPVSSADNLGTVWTQIRSDKLSGLIKAQTASILMVFLREFLQKVYFEKILQRTKKHEKLPSVQLTVRQGSWKPLQYFWRTLIEGNRFLGTFQVIYMTNCSVFETRLNYHKGVGLQSG